MSKLKRLLSVGVTVVLAGLAFSVPAEASVSQGFIGGAGVVTDDWGDEGVLARDTFPNSNATGLWQLVLWADGALESNGTPFDLADVDCEFGPNTEAATRNLQRTYGLSADGRVGVNTFSTVDNFLTDRGGGVIRYDGFARDVDFRRIDGQYQIQVGASGFRVAFYRTSNAC